MVDIEIVRFFAGVCMVYVAAHWPTDILAGWALGLFVGGFAVIDPERVVSWGKARLAPSSSPGDAASG